MGVGAGVPLAKHVLISLRITGTSFRPWGSKSVMVSFAGCSARRRMYGGLTFLDAWLSGFR